MNSYWIKRYALSGYFSGYWSGYCWALLILLGAVQVHAQQAKADASDPVVTMQAAIDDVLAKLKTNEALYKTNPQQLRDIVAHSALPHFAIKRMAQLALAKHWRSATEAQREVYLREFERYLMRSYTRTLFLYRSASTEMMGRDDNGPDKTILKLRVKNARGESVILFLRLVQQDNNWKIVDINVEGISLVVTARGVFDDEINKKGLAAFLQNMTEQNNKAALNDSE